MDPVGMSPKHTDFLWRLFMIKLVLSFQQWEWQVKHSPAPWILCGDPSNFKSSCFDAEVLSGWSIKKIESFKANNYC